MFFCSSNSSSTKICGKVGKALIYQRFFIHRRMWIKYKLFTGKNSNFVNAKFPQEFCPHFHKLWKTVLYRQELIFAVISRMWFCREVSPALRAFSTLLME